MMRLARRFLLLVAFYILTSSATASAECAWVLWVDDESISSRTGKTQTWDILSAHETKQACEARSNVAWKERREWLSGLGFGIGHVPVPGYVGGAKRWDDGTTTSIVNRYYCLPDTIDPRGPKGK